MKENNRIIFKWDTWIIGGLDLLGYHHHHAIFQLYNKPGILQTRPLFSIPHKFHIIHLSQLQSI